MTRTREAYYPDEVDAKWRAARDRILNAKPKQATPKPQPRIVVVKTSRISDLKTPITYPVPKPFIPQNFIYSPPRSKQIIKEVCEQFGLTLAAICAEGRQLNCVKARAVAAHRLKKELGWSTPRIGRLLARDHSSILNLLKSYDDIIAEPTEQRVSGEPDGAEGQSGGFSDAIMGDEVISLPRFISKHESRVFLENELGYSLSLGASLQPGVHGEAAE